MIVFRRRSLSNGTDIDAGLIKQVTGFSINGSQHLIVSYNDGSTSDLGEIFSGNITISGNLTVSGSINGESAPSVKPIYYHPIYLYGTDTSGTIIRILLSIFDNNSVAYTLSTIVSKIVSLINAGAILNVDGIIVDTNNKAYNAYMIKNEVSGNLLFWAGESTRGEINLTDITWALCQDGVNKIN